MFGKQKLIFSQKEYAIGGIISSILAIASMVTLGYGVYISFEARGMGSEIVGALGLLSMVIAFFGMIFGYVSYKEQDKHYGPSFFGTFANGIILILLILFVLIGL